MEKDNKLTQAMQNKKSDFSEWYPEVMTKSDAADYTSVGGCIVMRPYSYALWENIVKIVDDHFRKMGIQNAYFPLFIPEKLLTKEAEHIKGFSPEVAWVTHAGDKKLDERLAVRPTSETIMYDSYSKWIKSWRDLPLRLNQWNNVVRWEFTHAVPFLRGREFLWNEGHTAFATEEEAMKEVDELLGMYYKVVTEKLALAAESVRLTDKEKFAGGVASWKIISMLPNGKTIEGPAVHYDGQNFAKAFGIEFLNKEGKKDFAYQNTFAISTRMLGVIFGIHGDDKGLIVPPRVAPIQAVIIPIYKNDTKEEVMKEATKVFEKLSDHVKVKLDDRENYTPGWKYNEWELKGVPLRIEIGPRDIKESSVTVARRDTGAKESIKISSLAKKVDSLLEDIHNTLYERSKKFLEEHTVTGKSMEDIKNNIEDKRVLVDWCGDQVCEDKVKAEFGAKSTGIPMDKKAQGKCAICGKPAKKKVYFSRSY